MAIQFKATSEFQQVVNDYEKLLRQNIRLQERMRQVSQQSRRNNDFAKSFAREQLAGFKSLVGGTKAFDVALQAVRGTFQFVRAEAEQAIATIDGLVDSRRRLNQIAISSVDRQALETRSDDLAMAHGVQRDLARSVVFDARSKGIDNSTVDEIMRNSRIVAPDTASLLASKLPAIFGEQQISEMEAINLGVAAAQSSELDVEQFTEVFPTAAQGVQLAGGDAIESAAITSVLADRFADKATVGRLARSFGTRLSLDPELGGEGIMAGFEKLRSMDEGERREFLKENQELNVMYDALSREFDDIQQRRSELAKAVAATGTESSPLSQARAAAFDPTTEIGRLNIAEQDLARARVARETARETRFAETGAGGEQAREEVQAFLDLSRRSGPEKFAADKAAGFAQFLGLDEEGVRSAGIAGAEVTRGAGQIISLLTGSERGLPSESPEQSGGTPGTVVEKLDQLVTATQETNSHLSTIAQPDALAADALGSNRESR